MTSVLKLLRPRLPYVHRHHTSRRTFTIDVQQTAISIPSLSATFPFTWLRDSCQCPSCVHPSTRQKLHRSSDIPGKIKPASTDASVQITSDPDGLKILWEDLDGQGQHLSTYTAQFLQRYSSSANLMKFHRDIFGEPWTSDRYASLSREELTIPYAKLSEPATLLSVYSQLVRHGLVFFREVPPAKISDEACELRVLAEKLGKMRKTFYGETWDVRNVRNSKNIAYTNLDLGLHMDLLYFKEPPRYQILHCLRNKVKGGQSIFVDGLRAALQLAESSPEDFSLLVSTPVNFHYINDGHHLHCSHPTVQLEQVERSKLLPQHTVYLQGAPFRITSINYSPPFQAPLSIVTPPTFYSALAKYSAFLNEPNNCFTHLLHEGEAVIFDNRRVLHGRASFEDVEDNNSMDGQTNRWLKGCYLEEDPVLDRMRMLSVRINPSYHMH